MQSSKAPNQLESLSTKLQLFLSCNNLKDVNILGHTDSSVIVYIKEQELWKKIG